MIKTEKLPPQSIEAEQGVLGSILEEGRLIHEIRPLLRPGDFYRDAHEAIYAAMLDMADRGESIDPVTLHDRLATRGHLERAGGFEGIKEITEAVPFSFEWRAWAEIVAQKATARAYIEAANQILREAYSDRLDPYQLQSRSEASVLSIGTARERRGLATIDEAIQAATDAIDRQLAGERSGIPTELDDLDEILGGGLQRGHLIVIGAQPSIGKSALALGFALAAGRAGVGQVLICSCEMPLPEIGGRILSSRAGVDGSAIQNPARHLQDEDRAAIERFRRDARGLPIWIDTSPRRTVAEIASQARRLRHKGPLAMIVVDYLQLITAGSRQDRAARHEQVAAVSRDLHELAMELDVPVVVPSQVNRESERSQAPRRGDEKHKVKAPWLADLRESGAIEQDANVVLLLHRPEFHDSEDRPGEAFLHIAKQRGGRTERIKLRFRKELTRFENWDEPLPDLL